MAEEVRVVSVDVVVAEVVLAMAKAWETPRKTRFDLWEFKHRLQFAGLRLHAAGPPLQS